MLIISSALFLEHLASSDITLSNLNDETIISISSFRISTFLKDSIFSIVIFDFENLVNDPKFSNKNFVISLSTIMSAPFESTIISPIFSLFTPNFITAPK